MKKKAFVFDLDGTLFETTAQELEHLDGHARFAEFADASKLLSESTPRSLVAFAREVQAEGHDVYILTARNSIVSHAIQQLLADHDILPKYIFTVGDRGFDVPAYKAEILSQLAQTHKTYFFDDDEENLAQAPANIRRIKA
jgi:FMN phosphatase YigB (HAD superfamily)